MESISQGAFYEVTTLRAVSAPKTERNQRYWCV
ncbi:hypothetical protein [Enterococcus rivorum]